MTFVLCAMQVLSLSAAWPNPAGALQALGDAARDKASQVASALQDALSLQEVTSQPAAYSPDMSDAVRTTGGRRRW
jgi:hypothetical protein